MNKTKFTVWTIVIAALYASLTILLSPFSYSYFQVRVAEALTLMPLLLGPAAVLGLFIGCLISNLFSPVGLVDVIFGSLATLIAATFTWKLNRGSALLGAFWPVLWNTIIVGFYLSWFYNVELIVAYLGVAIGEAIACYVIGVPLVKALQSRIPKSIWKY
jgi:uncharacterized membrane protein